jgi:predicted nucleotidyltransferase
MTHNESTSMNSPNAAITEFEAQIGAKWLNIGASCDLSCRTRSELAKSLAGIDSEDTSIIVSGSLARNEFTHGSDIDWSLLVDGFADANHQAVREKVAPIINQYAGKGPGQEGTFGQLAFSHELVHQIGGEDDTNRNTTRRLLLLLESAVVGRPDAYERVVKNVLQRYILEDDGFVNTSGKYHVPRFLQNDFARYWRTMAVDFAYKRRTRSGKGAAIRNLKLRMSRKLLYASGLLTCFGCHLERIQRPALIPCSSVANTHECVACLRESMRRTPLEILASVFLRFPHLNDAGRTLFDAYDEFLGMLASDETRDALEKLPPRPSPDDRVWSCARRVSHSFRNGLLELFFDSKSGLYDLTRMYGVF